MQTTIAMHSSQYLSQFTTHNANDKQQPTTSFFTYTITCLLNTHVRQFLLVDFFHLFGNKTS